VAALAFCGEEREDFMLASNQGLAYLSPLMRFETEATV